MILKIKREIVSHLIEYGYLAEKTTGTMLLIATILVIVIIPAWPTALINYIRSPAVYGLSSLGNSILITTLLIAAGFTAYLIPHFAPIMKPHGFREARDVRTKILYSTLIASIVSITILIYLIASLTLFL